MRYSPTDAQPEPASDTNAAHVVPGRFGNAVRKPATMTLVERLGYPADRALLLVTGDDIGFVHGVNEAFVKGLNHGVIRSGSVMVVCPWFAEVAAFAAANADVDLGVHLTLTCETSPYRWGPVLGPTVPSLVRRDGGFPETEAEVAAQADIADVERELRAQVETARRAGLRPTHLDSHMGTLYHRLDFFEVLQRIAIDEALPIRYPPPWFRDPAIDRQAKAHEPELPRVDNVVSPSEEVDAKDWLGFYVRAVEDLRPGVTEMVFHPGYDDAEMRAAYTGMEGWGAAWRQRDIDVACDPHLREAIERRGATLIGWAEIAALMSR